MKREPQVTGYLADVDNRRALGYFRLLSQVLSGRDPYPNREEDEPQELLVMEMPSRLQPAAAGFSPR
jgi:hypothetical protein